MMNLNNDLMYVSEPRDLYQETIMQEQDDNYTPSIYDAAFLE